MKFFVPVLKVNRARDRKLKICIQILTSKLCFSQYQISCANAVSIVSRLLKIAVLQAYEHCNQEILNTYNHHLPTKITCLTFTLMSHSDPPCSYALTRQEADHLKISSTYRTARLNIQTVDPNYPASPEMAEKREVSSFVLSFEDATELFALLLACRMSLTFALVIPS